MRNLGTHKELVEAAIRAYQTRLPMMVWGPPGIGKSQVIRQVGQKLAGSMQLRYTDDPREWKGADDTFVLVDLRISYMDPTDLTGVLVGRSPDGKKVVLRRFDLPEKGH